MLAAATDAAWAAAMGGSDVDGRCQRHREGEGGEAGRVERKAAA